MPELTKPTAVPFFSIVETVAVEVADGPSRGTMVSSGGEPLTIGKAEGNDLVLDDDTVSRFHVEIVQDPNGIRVVDKSSTNGTFVDQVRITDAVVPSGSMLKLGNTHVLVRAGGKATVPLFQEPILGRLRGRSTNMRRMMAKLDKVAQTDTPVLLIGESGTGKELIAEAIHERSQRADEAFEIVDCGSLAANLIASELFGHEKGAFTGADRRHVGAFERANGGTIFLDEIGELPSELQPNLLGALERRRFRRVGGREEIHVNVRVVSATNRDLRAEVNKNTFRLDLYYRLAVVSVPVPALRDREGDIEELIEHFLDELGAIDRKDEFFPPALLKSLETHHWPGNVRELRNMVEATVAMGEAPELMPHMLGAVGSSPPSAVLSPSIAHLPFKEARRIAIRDFESDYARQLLERCDGNVSQAARTAGLDRSYLFSILKRHKLR